MVFTTIWTKLYRIVWTPVIQSRTNPGVQWILIQSECFRLNEMLSVWGSHVLGSDLQFNLDHARRGRWRFDLSWKRLGPAAVCLSQQGKLTFFRVKLLKVFFWLNEVRLLSVHVDRKMSLKAEAWPVGTGCLRLVVLTVQFAAFWPLTVFTLKVLFLKMRWNCFSSFLQISSSLQSFFFLPQFSSNKWFLSCLERNTWALAHSSACEVLFHANLQPVWLLCSAESKRLAPYGCVWWEHPEESFLLGSGEAETGPLQPSGRAPGHRESCVRSAF